jgi:hypothetical protein
VSQAHRRDTNLLAMLLGFMLVGAYLARRAGPIFGTLQLSRTKEASPLDYTMLENQIFQLYRKTSDVRRLPNADPKRNSCGNQEQDVTPSTHRCFRLDEFIQFASTGNK